jgi:solute carrier family 1 (neutral amino acid transporter), member 5
VSRAAQVMSLSCNSGAFLTMAANGLVSCSANAPATVTQFTLNDTTGYFASRSTGFVSLSVTDQIFAILKSLVPDNIINAFATSATLSVITFAVAFGIALTKSVDRSREDDNYPLLLIAHANVLCRLLVNKVVTMIPIAITSMIAGSMAQSASSTEVFKSVGYLIIALLVGLTTMTIGVLGTVLFLTTRRNVFSYLRKIVPAQIFIFGCSSSIATLPITLRCVEAAREVSPALARFVLPLGATSNLNGTAVYMPLACIFMASVSGNEAALTPLTYVMLALVGAISSFGVAPVPFSGLVMMITVWRTVFGLDVPPQAFSLLVGAEWILNRMRAIVNITNDTILVRIIAQQCDETTDEQLSKRDSVREEAPPSPHSPLQTASV